MRRRRLFYCGRVNPAPMVLGGLVLAAACGLHLRLAPVIADMAAYQARSIASQAVSSSVEQVLRQTDISYDQLALITRNGQGSVTSVQTDMPKINALGTAVTNSAIGQIDRLSSQRVELPLGTLLGSSLLSGRGPKVGFYVVPTGYVQSTVENRFVSAGINQTLHSILLQLEIGVMGVLPGCRSSTAVTTEICLAETVIVGAVPEYFTQIEEGGEDLSGLLADYGADKNRAAP